MKMINQELDKQLNMSYEDQLKYLKEKYGYAKEFYNNLENLGCILVDKYIEVTLVKYKDVILGNRGNHDLIDGAIAGSNLLRISEIITFSIFVLYSSGRGCFVCGLSLF